MNQALQEMIGLLDLEQIDDNTFRGQSRDIGTPQIFGGQVLGQALAAAHRTVSGRSAHSMHAYFLRPGAVDEPVVYQVDRARDGATFSSRRVVAVQRGVQIFNMAASFQVPETGLEHQAPMPEVTPPDALQDLQELARERGAAVPARVTRFLTHRRPFSVKPVVSAHFLATTAMEPVKRVWMKAVERLPDDELLHLVLFAYISDYELIGTAMLPHGLHTGREGVQMASLDHAIWFHRPLRVDEWLLFDLDSPTAVGARGLSRGHVFTQDGRLVASLAQEGLIRVRSERA